MNTVPDMKFIAVAATSLDGFITRGNEPGTAFTSRADKEWFSKAMKSFPVKIVGRKTFDESKDAILEQVAKESSDLRLVLTRSPGTYEQWQTSERLEFINTTPSGLAERIGKSQHWDSDIAVLGGGAVYSAFLQSGLLDEFWITLEPQLFGRGTPIVIDRAEQLLELKETIQLGPSTLLLKYRCG